MSKNFRKVSLIVNSANGINFVFTIHEQSLTFLYVGHVSSPTIEGLQLQEGFNRSIHLHKAGGFTLKKNRQPWIKSSFFEESSSTDVD